LVALPVWAAGSSTQVGVLVVPFCVVLAWMMGQPLDLNFNEFEALVLFISVLLAAVVVQVRRGGGRRGRGHGLPQSPGLLKLAGACCDC
jgi:hypothetical protein